MSDPLHTSDDHVFDFRVQIQRDKLVWIVTLLYFAAMIVGQLAYAHHISTRNPLLRFDPDFYGIGVAFFDVTLAALFLIFARVNLLLRIPIAIGIAYAGGLVGSVSEQQSLEIDFVGLWQGAMMILLVAQAALLLVFRLFGWRLTYPTDLPIKDQRAWQFNLFGLLTLTTAVAIVCGFARYASLLNYPLDGAKVIAIIAASNLIASLVVATLLQPYARIVTPIAVVLAIGVNILLLNLAIDQRAENVRVLAVLFALLLFTASLLKLLGYRLERITSGASA